MPEDTTGNRVSSTFTMHDCSVTFAGPAAFVQRQLDRFRGLFQESLQGKQAAKPTPAKRAAPTRKEAGEPKTEDNAIKTAASAVKAASPKTKAGRILALAYAISRERGKKPVTLDDILLGLAALGQHMGRKAVHAQTNVLRYRQKLLATAGRGALSTTKAGAVKAEAILRGEDVMPKPGRKPNDESTAAEKRPGHGRGRKPGRRGGSRAPLAQFLRKPKPSAPAEPPAEPAAPSEPVQSASPVSSLAPVPIVVDVAPSADSGRAQVL